MFTDIEIALQTVMDRKNSIYGLRLFKECLESLGNPQYDLKCIHIGGTNGKGSTTNYVRSGLQKEGFKVGTFTSPHLIIHNDRIRINDINISDEDLLHYINQSYPLWDEFSLSMFEIDMLISIWYFIDQKVDYVVYEVGLGGTLDASNIIKPLVSAITNVDMDHMNILGDTLEAIAEQKAGIIKENSPLFTTETKSEILDIFSDFCERVNTEMHVVQIPSSYKINKDTFFNVDGLDIVLHNQAQYQVSNASLAVNILRYLGVDDLSIKEGVENTQWAGRFEELLPNIYLDGAHNLVGIQQLIQSLEGLERPLTVVFSALKDKDYEPMVDLLEEHFDEVIITEFNFYRAESAVNLAKNRDVKIINDWKDALRYINASEFKGTRFVTGSLYFISEAREFLNKISNHPL